MRNRFVLFLSLAAATTFLFGQPGTGLRMATTIQMPRVNGRIDHMAIDMEYRRLFVAATENNSLEVIDLRTDRVVQSLHGLKNPQDLVYIHHAGRLYVTAGGDGKCHVFSGYPLRETGAFTIGEDADNIRYDPAADRLYIAYGKGALSVHHPASMRRIAEIRLPGHPESFQLETGGPKIYVNVPGAGQIAVVDRVKEQVLTSWRLDGLQDNYPMALVEEDQRVLVATRNPAKLVVFDAVSGKQVSATDCAGDADDLIYNPAKKLVYVACGEGVIDVFARRSADRYEATFRIRTVPGARTALWVPDLSELFLASPARGAFRAGVRIYR
jgi:DNA-binding beta-propeller fold protein YncE